MQINILRKIQRDRRNKKINNEIKYYEEILESVDYDNIINYKIDKIDTFIFLIPPLIKYSGGQTSILRLGTELYNLGYDVIYTTYKEQEIEESKIIAKFNLDNYKGKFVKFEELKSNKNNVVVSTFWESVYYAKKLDGFKVYFVQDYEPFFYNYGEKYILAEKTYNMEMPIISLGKWNIEMIKKMNKSNFSDIHYIDFPYERKEYQTCIRDFEVYREKKEFNICVYIKESEKRAPYIVQSIVNETKLLFAKKGIKLNITYFGGFESLKLKNGINKGKLNKNELMNLYSQSDFGLVASLSNISLIPYEMAATKLPIVEFKEGSFLSFFDEKDAIIIDFDKKTLYNQLEICINTPSILNEKTDTIYNKLNKLSWKKSTYQFLDIIEKIATVNIDIEVQK